MATFPIKWQWICILVSAHNCIKIVGTKRRCGRNSMKDTQVSPSYLRQRVGEGKKSLQLCNQTQRYQYLQISSIWGLKFTLYCWYPSHCPSWWLTVYLLPFYLILTLKYFNHSEMIAVITFWIMAIRSISLIKQTFLLFLNIKFSYKINYVMKNITALILILSHCYTLFKSSIIVYKLWLYVPSLCLVLTSYTVFPKDSQRTTFSTIHLFLD